MPSVPEETPKVVTDQELRAALNDAVSKAIRWKRMASKKESRINGLKEFSSELVRILKEDMVDDEGTSLWDEAEMTMVFMGCAAIVAYGSIFPEKQKSILMKLSREQNKEEE